MRSEISTTPSGIEPTNFRLAAQCLKQVGTEMPQYNPDPPSTARYVQQATVVSETETPCLAVGGSPLDAEARVWYRISPCEICGEQSALGEVFLPVLQISPVSTIPPMLHTHSFTYHPHYIMFLSQYFSFPLSVPFHQCSIPIHSLPPTLYNVSQLVLQFSPVSTIPPTLHTHSFTYHSLYLLFLSQYFSFPLSVPFHRCSTPIHSTTTHPI